MMEAMACGCAVVSLATCMIPEIITHGENGLLGSNAAELKDHMQRLLDNPEEARIMGEKARETIEGRFGLEQFVNNWRTMLLDTSRIPYRGEMHNA